MSNGQHIVVVGAGIAGAAAAWSAERAMRGGRVTLVDGGAGATSFTSGALDREPWEALDALARRAPTSSLAIDPLADGVTAFLDALGGWEIASGRPAWLATVGGRVRPALGRDVALLDLGAIAGRRVLVPRADRASWDADALARAWNAEIPDALGVRFAAVDCAVLRRSDEGRIADGELAMRHDDDARIAWLVERLGPVLAANGGKAACAVLLGPWLGADVSVAARLSSALGVPVGEALSGTAGSAGLRFESARARLFRGATTTVRGRVVELAPDGDALAVSFSDAQPTLRASSVVLAVGGLVGGGLVFDPPERTARHDGPTAGRPAYRLSLRVAPELLTHGGFRTGGSIHGPVLDDTAWPKGPKDSALEAAGLHHDGAALSPRLFVAGEVCAGAPRTLAAAIATGVVAGKKAALVADQAGNVTSRASTQSSPPSSSKARDVDTPQPG